MERPPHRCPHTTILYTANKAYNRATTFQFQKRADWGSEMGHIGGTIERKVKSEI